MTLTSKRNQARSWARFIDKRNKINVLEVTFSLKKSKNSDEVIDAKVSIADPVHLIQYMLAVDPELIYGK